MIEKFGAAAAAVLLSGGLVVVSIICWGLTLLGLPGNWGLVLACLGYDGLVEDGSRRELGLKLIAVLALLALLGEVIEFVAGAFGVRKRGGSALSAGLAMVGSFIGAVMGGVISLPVPVIGQLIGVLIGASAGAMAGAIVGEDLRGRTLTETMHVGWGAFWGRLWGTGGKTVIGTVMVVIAWAGMLF